MKHFVYEPEDGYFNHFITTGTYTRKQEFKRVTLSGKVNEWLTKDFSIYENPCRKEFIETRRTELPPYLDISGHTLLDELEVFGQERTMSVYYPFGCQGVEFSEFYPNPTFLRCYSYVLVFAEREEEARLVLETCGGLTLWVNDALVTDFVPFTRNMKKQSTVKVKLKKGFNKFVVCLDDLAERDTDYYFRIRYQGEAHLKLCLPMAEEVDVEAMEQIEQALSNCFFERETYISEPVILKLKNPLKRDLKITAMYKPVADKISHAEKLMCKNSYEWKAGEEQLVLFRADDVLPGFYYIKVRAGIDGVWAERTIATQVFQKELLISEDTSIEERKARALHYLAEYEVDNVYKAAAILATGGEIRKAEAVILEELEGISARKDCSDFHLVVVLQIWKLFGDRLSEPVKEAIRQVALNFRYWIDEPGNDVMWFFSENHALLFHVCQYYAGSQFPDETFTNSGFTGREQMKRAEKLLEEWFEAFFRDFITEWNSNAYIPVDVLGLCGLYNLAEEKSIWKEKAGKALDWLFRDMAVNEHKGAVMTTFGRSYEKESKGNYAAGTTSLLYLAYNTGNLNRASLAYISFILGNYVPPKDFGEFTELLRGKGLTFEKTQGYESHVNLYQYKNSRVELSTAVAFHPFSPGYQEHIMQATLDMTAQMYVTHPGEVQPYGQGRPNYWAGNGSLPLAAQYRNLGMMVYHIPKEHPVSFTHAYAPLMEFERYVGTQDTLAAEKNGGYLGVRALNGLMMKKDGPCRGREFISPGRDNVWLVKVGTKEEYGSLAEFGRELEQTAMEWKKGEVLKVTDKRLGVLELFKKELLADGKPVYHFPCPCTGVITWIKEGDR